MGICYCVKLDRHLEMKAAWIAELTIEEVSSRFLLSLNFPFSGVTNSSAALCTVNWSGRTCCSPPLSTVTACSRNAASFSFAVTHLCMFSHRLLDCPAREGRHCGGAAEPALAGTNLLPCPNDQAIRLCLLWHWWEELRSALHAVTLPSGTRTWEHLDFILQIFLFIACSNKCVKPLHFE